MSEVSNETIEGILNGSPEVDLAKVSGDGYHYQLIVVSEAFASLSKVARQQWVYSLLNEFITSGSLHAISMQTYTKDEWEKTLG